MCHLSSNVKSDATHVKHIWTSFLTCAEILSYILQLAAGDVKNLKKKMDESSNLNCIKKRVHYLRLLLFWNFFSLHLHCVIQTSFLLLLHRCWLHGFDIQLVLPGKRQSPRIEVELMEKRAALLKNNQFWGKTVGGFSESSPGCGQDGAERWSADVAPAGGNTPRKQSTGRSDRSARPWRCTTPPRRRLPHRNVQVVEDGTTEKAQRR